jgi:4-amino-4-deoxy-L-arabinose transferase-like glycosyltransferase
MALSDGVKAISGLTMNVSMENQRLGIFLTEDIGLSRKRIVLELTLLTLVGFIVRILVAQLFLGGLSRGYEGDESGYMSLAMHIAQGLGFTDKSGTPTSYVAPGLPILLMIPISFLGPHLPGIRLYMCLIESLLIPACYLLARSVSHSRIIGLIAAAIAIFFPTWIIPSGAILTDIPATIFVTLLMWMLIESNRRESLLWFTASGVVWSLGILVRAVSLSYALAIILWLLLRVRGWRRRVAAIAAVIISAGCVLAPWTIRNTRVHGEFVLVSTQGGVELYKSNNPEATGILAIDHAHFYEGLAQQYPRERFPGEAERSRMFQGDAIRFIIENPYRFAELCFIRFVQFWKLYSPRVPLINSIGVIASFGLILPFFVIQLVRRSWRPGPEMLFLFIILCHTSVAVVFGSILRYRLPIEPMILVMAIQGFYSVFAIMRNRPRQQATALGLNVSR